MISSLLGQENAEIRKSEKGSGGEYELQPQYRFGFHLFRPFSRMTGFCINCALVFKKDVSVSLETQLKK